MKNQPKHLSIEEIKKRYSVGLALEGSHDGALWESRWITVQVNRLLEYVVVDERYKQVGETERIKCKLYIYICLFGMEDVRHDRKLKKELTNLFCYTFTNEHDLPHGDYK